MTERTVVAVLGTGIMGAPIARNLLTAGFTVRVWNRSLAKAEPLVEEGAILAETPGQAAGGADVVLTMLADGSAVRETIEAALPNFGAETVWAQCSTVGVEHTETFRELAARHGIRLVDAPVLGTRQPAEAGQLVVLASGAEADRTRLAGVFTAIGTRTVDVGEQPGAASRLKLVANNWVLALTNATAETVTLAGELGLDPNLFLEAITGTGVDVPYAHLKGTAMITGEHPLSFPLDLASKDARLILEAGGEAGLDATRAALRHLEVASERGHGEQDMSAIQYGLGA